MSLRILLLVEVLLIASLLLTNDTTDTNLDSTSSESQVAKMPSEPSNLLTARRIAAAYWGRPAFGAPELPKSASSSADSEGKTASEVTAPDPSEAQPKETLVGTNHVIQNEAHELNPAASETSALEIQLLPPLKADHAEAWDVGNKIAQAVFQKNGNEATSTKDIATPASFQQADENVFTGTGKNRLMSELDSIKTADINDPALGEPQLDHRFYSATSAKPESRTPESKLGNPGWWIHSLQQPLLSGRQVLSTNIDEVIFVALQNSPQVQILNTRPVIQETFIGEADAQFDWNQFVETTWEELDEPVGSSLTTGSQGRFFQREWSLDAGLQRQLRNGGTFNLTQRFGTLDNNSDFLDPPDQGNSQLFLDYRQPLLQNRGRFVNTSQIALASLDFDAVNGQSRTELQEYLVSVVQNYWNVYFRRAALVINRRGLERGQELLRQLRLRDGIDVRNDQLLRAEAAVAARQTDLIRAEYDLINAQDQLINVSIGPKYGPGVPEQIEFVPAPFDLPLGIQFEPTAVAQSAIQNRPEIEQSIAQLRAAAVRNHVLKNQVLPRLDAVITTTVNGLRGSKDVGNAFTDQFTRGNPSYSAGFEFEIPVGNRAAKLRAERARMEMAVAHQEFESQLGDVLVDARIASREISRLNNENENNWNALTKANEELFFIQERQRLQLDDGKVGSLYIEDLLASQARLTAAELRLAQSQTEQAVALVDLKRAVGVLVSGKQTAALPVTASHFILANAEIPPLEMIKLSRVQPLRKFVNEVLPPINPQPVSNYPVPTQHQQVFQPNCVIENLPQGQGVCHTNEPNVQQPVPQPRLARRYPLHSNVEPPNSTTERDIDIAVIPRTPPTTQSNGVNQNREAPAQLSSNPQFANEGQPIYGQIGSETLQRQNGPMATSNASTKPKRVTTPRQAAVQHRSDPTMRRNSETGGTSIVR